MRAWGAILAGTAAFVVVAHLSGQQVNIRLRLPGRRRRGPAAAVWLRQAGLDVTPGQFLAVRAGVGLAVLVVVWGLTGSAFVAAVPALVAGWLPRAYFARRRADRLGEVVRAWPDGIRHVIAAARARGTIHQALVELARSGPAPLAEAFERYPALATMAGPVAALETLREELADPTSDAVIEILICAQEQGQALAIKILRDLAGEVSEDLKALEEIESAGLERKIDSRLTFVIPWFVLVALCATSEAYRGFYRSAGGAIVVVVCGVMSVAGVAVVDRMGRLPRPRRVLGVAAGEPR
ncbi:MAG: hypothetical protein KY447_05150 [Actinobacteria bacterium]|nr:hypothetical protein [Actinomycetota bacterium]